MLENFFGEEIEKTVFLSAAQMREAHPGPVRGKYFKDTAIFNIFPPELSERGEFLGQILPEGFEPNAKGFCGVARQEKIQFYFDGKPINAEPYELHQNIFSRNKGILETDKMDHKRAVILGCGSVGSLVAMELARSGVGHFLLADPDVMEYHNICRHQCGIEDVGDLKINALKRKLLNINPQIDVQIFEGIVQNIPKAMLDDFCVKGETVFVGCADNRGADVYANRISIYIQSWKTMLPIPETACPVSWSSWMSSRSCLTAEQTARWQSGAQIWRRRSLRKDVPTACIF